MKLLRVAQSLGWKSRNVDDELELGPPCIDSRTCQPGDVFWGLKGKRDGGQFAAAALDSRALAVVVSEEWANKLPPEKPVVIVDDVLKALTSLAVLARSEFKGKVFALTGSCGKTGAKELIAHVLSQKYKVLKSPASYNNEIGVPFTVSQLGEEWQAAVLEIGANHPGEIASLCQVARPEMGLITMVGRAHLEGFGSIKGVAEAKGELFRNLTGDKIAFVNFDDAYVVGQSAGMSKRIGYGFGLPPAGQGFARIYRGVLKPGRGFSLLERDLVFQYPDYMMIHSLSAAAVGHFMGVESYKIEEALKSFPGVPGRMQRLEVGGVVIYDDTYNSNPSSLQAALAFIAGIPEGRKIAVLGAMKELGEYSGEEHSRAIEICRELKFDKCFTLGDEFADIADSNYYEDKSELARDLLEFVKPGDTALFKGSRLLKMEDILKTFTDRLKGMN